MFNRAVVYVPNYNFYYWQSPPANYHFTMENSILEGRVETVKNIIGLGAGGGAKAGVTFKYPSNKVNK